MLWKVRIYNVILSSLCACCSGTEALASCFYLYQRALSRDGDRLSKPGISTNPDQSSWRHTDNAKHVDKAPSERNEWAYKCHCCKRAAITRSCQGCVKLRQRDFHQEPETNLIIARTIPTQRDPNAEAYKQGSGESPVQLSRITSREGEKVREKVS